MAAVAALFAGWSPAVGALAAATADTWATEIGSFSPWPPRLVTTWAPVARGTSGGVTLLGTGGGVVGAGVIAWLATVLQRQGIAPGFALLAGVAGMFADSLLGATVQGLYECPSCGARSEQRTTVCHEPVTRIRGFAWLDNDGVNLAATVVGATVAGLGARG